MNHPARINVVIFDLGNVVFNWDVDAILDSLDPELPGMGADDLKILRDELFAHQDWLDMDHGKQTQPEVIANICNRSALNRNAVERALLVAQRSLVPIEETLGLMREISERGMEMHCLSNMSREFYDHIREYELFDMFSGIVISGIEGCMKPDEEIFQLAIDRFELQPQGTLFIDDSLPNIETARRLGIHGFHFKRSPGCYSEIRKLLL